MKKIVAVASVITSIGGGSVLCVVGTMYEMIPDMFRHASLIGLFFILLGICIAGAMYENSEKAKYEETHIKRRL